MKIHRANMFVYVDDADATYVIAIKAGATSVMEHTDLVATVSWKTSVIEENKIKEEKV